MEWRKWVTIDGDGRAALRFYASNISGVITELIRFDGNTNVTVLGNSLGVTVGTELWFDADAGFNSWIRASADDIVEHATNDIIAWGITSDQDVYVTSGTKFSLEGVAGGTLGDTYFVSDGSDTIEIFSGGVEKWTLNTNGNFELRLLDRVVFDGVGSGTNHTWMGQTVTSPDTWQLLVGGDQAIKAVELSTEVSVIIGAENVLADNATTGFLYIPQTDTGTPTGVPTAYTGKSAIVFDPANKVLYIYNTDSSAWEGVSVG